MPRLGLTAALLSALCVSASACTTKRVLEIHTNPPGAHIWVNGTHLEKRTPVEIPFTHYGWWDVRLEKEGYLSVAQEVRVKAGVDGYPIVDLFAETVTPEKRFRRSFDLTPIGAAPTDAEVAATMKEANAFRKRTYEEARASEAPKRLLPGSDDLLP